MRQEEEEEEDLIITVQQKLTEPKTLQKRKRLKDEDLC